MSLVSCFSSSIFFSASSDFSSLSCLFSFLRSSTLYLRISLSSSSMLKASEVVWGGIMTSVSVSISISVSTFSGYGLSQIFLWICISIRSFELRTKVRLFAAIANSKTFWLANIFHLPLTRRYIRSLAQFVTNTWFLGPVTSANFLKPASTV